jgi:hypothetical protein
MLCFEVRRNGQLVCTAGGDDLAVLNVIINWLSGKGKLFYGVGGLTKDSAPVKEHVRWVNLQPLAIGDEVSVRIVDLPACDQPSERHPGKRP